MKLVIWIFASVVPVLLTSRPLLAEENSPPAPPSANSEKKEKAIKAAKDAAAAAGKGAKDAAVAAGKGAKAAAQATGNWLTNQYKARSVDARNVYWHSQLLIKARKWPAKPPVDPDSEACSFANSHYTKDWKSKVVKSGGVLKMFQQVQEDVDSLKLLCAQIKTLHNVIHYKGELDKLLEENCDDNTKGVKKVDGTVQECVKDCNAAEEAAQEHYDKEVDKEEQAKAKIQTIRCKHVGNYLEKLSEATKPHTASFSSKSPAIATLVEVVKRAGALFKSGKGYVTPTELEKIKSNLDLTEIKNDLQRELDEAVQNTKSDATGAVANVTTHLTTDDSVEASVAPEEDAVGASDAPQDETSD